MAQLRIMSDLHLEFHRDQGASFIESINPLTPDEILILAGDIHSHKGINNALVQFGAKWKHTIYVPGNHEYYGTEPHSLVQKLAAPANVYPLLGKSVLIGDVEFLGCTLWFKDRPDNHKYTYSMADFHHIKNLDPWVYRENKQHTEFLVNSLNTPNEHKRVVITHHMPTQEAVDPQYYGSQLNRFFLCPIADDPTLTLPDVWVFGHTHSPCRFVRQSCTFVCNPLGYPGERKPVFQEECIINV